MKPKRPWFIAWMLWLSTFIILELVAILSPDRGDTLSESIWFLQRGFWPLTIILAVLFVFLFVHFILDRRSRK